MTANYYDTNDVLFVENFENASKNDKGSNNGGGQKFNGTYGPKATAELQNKTFEMPVVIDPTKARAGEKAVTQGAAGTQAENIKAVVTGTESMTDPVWATIMMTVAIFPPVHSDFWEESLRNPGQLGRLPAQSVWLRVYRMYLTKVRTAAAGLIRPGLIQTYHVPKAGTSSSGRLAALGAKCTLTIKSWMQHLR